MPNNDDDHRTYDHHIHVDHNDDVCTHQHDDHPRHHHDNNGSVQYYLDDLIAELDIIDAVNQLDPEQLAYDTLHPLIGDTGFDITHRTPRSTRPAP